MRTYDSRLKHLLCYLTHKRGDPHRKHSLNRRQSAIFARRKQDCGLTPFPGVAGKSMWPTCSNGSLES